MSMQYQYMWNLQWEDAIDRTEAIHMAKSWKRLTGNNARFRLVMSPDDIRAFVLRGRKWCMT